MPGESFARSSPSPLTENYAAMENGGWTQQLPRSRLELSLRGQRSFARYGWQAGRNRERCPLAWAVDGCNQAAREVGAESVLFVFEVDERVADRREPADRLRPAFDVRLLVALIAQPEVAVVRGHLHGRAHLLAV